MNACPKTSALIISLGLLLCCTSCTRMLLGTYGIRQVKQLSDKSILHTAHRYGIENETVCTLDSAGYYRFLKSIRKKKETGFDMSFTAGGMVWGNTTAHDLGQPLQYLLFDKTGRLVSWHINCEAGGWPNLNWNHSGDFDRFPPVSGIPPDTNITLPALQPYWHRLMPGTKAQAADYTCVVYWARFMGRQSRRLVQLAVRNNHRFAGGAGINYLFVSDDNYFYCTLHR